MEESLLNAVTLSSNTKVRELLQSDPDIDVNGRNEEGFAALHLVDQIATATIFLLHPAIDVNLLDSQGRTPFFIYCEKGNASLVKLLLQDWRVAINRPSRVGSITPLAIASVGGHVDVVRWIIASGRWLRLRRWVFWGEFSALGLARGNSGVVPLLEQLRKDRRGTITALRNQLEITGELLFPPLPLHPTFGLDINVFFFTQTLW